MLIRQVIILVYSSAYNSQVVSTELADTFYDTSTVDYAKFTLYIYISCFCRAKKYPR
jgi:hypothetical protein